MKTHAQVRDQLGLHKCNPSALQTFGSDHRRHDKGVLAKRKVFGFINDRPPNTLIQPRTWILTTLKKTLSSRMP